jgi:hypothetical protein
LAASYKCYIFTEEIKGTIMKKGTFTSVWDGGYEISTTGELDEETGEVSTDSIDTNCVEVLDREYFTEEDGTEHTVCPDCHMFVMREKCIEGEGNGNDYDGELICSFPYCDSNLTIVS